MSPLQSGISPQQKPAGTPGEISGHIYSADTGEPLSEATVYFFFLFRSIFFSTFRNLIVNKLDF